jgi:dinuclear metal center YbgI/SA1388 family protein
MLTLDIDSNAVDYAVNNNIELIITHHPFLFSNIKSIDYNTYEGKLIRKLIINNINLYSMHTNFDMADMGVNQKLAEKLNILKYDVLHVVNRDLSGYGGVGNIERINIIKYAKEVKSKLSAEHIKLYCNDNERTIERVAFCGGSGSEFIEDAINKNADVYITGDIKYHQAQSALQNNLCIIDAGHYNTEYHSLENIKNILSRTNELNVMFLEKNTVEEQII